MVTVNLHTRCQQQQQEKKLCRFLLLLALLLGLMMSEKSARWSRASNGGTADGHIRRGDGQ